MKNAPTWSELLEILNDSSVALNDKGWNVYRFLAKNIGKCLSPDQVVSSDQALTSDEARTLLLLYLRLPLKRPSMLHSFMLGVALRMVDIYPDFKLPSFIKMWDINLLRTEDYQRQLDGSGRAFPSLVERFVKKAIHYMANNPAEAFDQQALALVGMYYDVEEVRKERIGYVEFFDEVHSFFHIYDSDSRHFVAISQEVRPKVGGYVWFSPIIPLNSKFKSAVVIRREEVITARQAFGITQARVTFVDDKKEYFAYQTNDNRKGNASLKLSPGPLAVGDEVHLILFLKRSKDGEKRLFVVEML